MDVYRKPETAEWHHDSARLVDSHEFTREAWSGTSAVAIDATKDKSGDRHTTMRVVLTETDVERLHAGLMQGRKDEIRSLSTEVEELRRTVHQLESALSKIEALASFERYSIPDSDEAFAAIDAIAGHFRHSWTRDKPFKHEFKWLKWKP